MNAQFCLLYVVGVFVIKLQRKWAQHARIEDFFAVCSIVLWSGARAALLEFLWTTMSILWFQRLHYFSLPNKFWILENKHPIFFYQFWEKLVDLFYGQFCLSARLFFVIQSKIWQKMLCQTVPDQTQIDQLQKVSWLHTFLFRSDPDNFYFSLLFFIMFQIDSIIRFLIKSDLDV